MSNTSQGPGWWQASDGRWYPPQGSQPEAQVSPSQVTATPVQASWTTMQVTGPLILASSDYEYAVYDQNQTYGRWPKSDTGKKYATETFEAHSKSVAHGLAYTATGYRDPATAGLPVEPVIKSQSYAAPLSYVGSTRRLIAWATKFGERSGGLAVVGWTLAIITMILAWVFVTAWYLVIFGLFGVFVIPYRLIRRSQRKSTHVQRTMLATQQAMLQQQQQTIIQQSAVYQPTAAYQQAVSPAPPAAIPSTQVPPNLPPPPSQS